MYCGGPMNRSIECYTAMTDNGRSREILSCNGPSRTTPSELLPFVNVLRKTLEKLKIRKTRIDNPETCRTLFMYQVVHIKELMSEKCIMGSGYVTFHLSLNVQAYAG